VFLILYSILPHDLEIWKTHINVQQIIFNWMFKLKWSGITNFSE